MASVSDVNGESMRKSGDGQKGLDGSHPNTRVPEAIAQRFTEVAKATTISITP
jgi:hypothetical protein